MRLRSCWVLNDAAFVSVRAYLRMALSAAAPITEDNMDQRERARGWAGGMVQELGFEDEEEVSEGSCGKGGKVRGGKKMRETKGRHLWNDDGEAIRHGSRLWGRLSAAVVLASPRSLVSRNRRH